MRRAVFAGVWLASIEDHGMDLDEDFANDLENGIRTGSISLHEASDWFAAAVDYWNLIKHYLPKEGKKPKNSFGLNTFYLSPSEIKDIRKASFVGKLKQLRHYAKVMPLYRRKAEAAIKSYYDKKVVVDTRLEGVSGVKELTPLTDLELKLVHKMPLQKGVVWLERNNERNTALRKAAESGLIKDAATFKELRDMDPTKATAKLEKLRG